MYGERFLCTGFVFYSVFFCLVGGEGEGDFIEKEDSKQHHATCFVPGKRN